MATLKERTAELLIENAGLKDRVANLERDLGDVLNFAAIPISRCRKCKRLALASGYVCFSCGHDPSAPHG